MSSFARRRKLLFVSETRPLPLAESDLVKQERVNVLSYALLHVLASIYVDPRTALRKIDALIAEKGVAAAFGALSNDPTQFGDIARLCDDEFIPSSTLPDVLSFACFALHFRQDAIDRVTAEPQMR